MRIFDRLAGLETEYVVRFRPDPGRSDRPSNRLLYDALVRELRRVLPVAPAKHFKKGVFLANGGAVWFERERQGPRAAKVEGATPECRGPRRLVACQRAQDALLSAAARDASAGSVGGEFTLCKSDRDAAGHVYGAQENYEVTVATGWRLRAWRVGIILLLPTVLFTWASALALMLAPLAYWAVAAAVFPLVVGACRMLRAVVRVPDRKAIRAFLFGPGCADFWAGDGDADFMPVWLEPVAHWASHLAFAPPALGLSALARVTAFRDVRRELLPFLVSRAVVCGSGRLTRDGKYHVAAKASGVNCVAGVNGIFGTRPVFSFAPFLKAMVFVGSGFRPLAAARQRLQIGLGDSNLCEESEYLRVGTTMLVLDAIEAGEMPPVPRIRRPVAALRRIVADPTLQARVRLSGGRRWTAVEIQRFYLRACQAFLARRDNPSPEALDVVRRWEEVLDGLENHPETLVGRVDWVTKRFLLEQCGADAAWEARKKIDLRYHELSPDGYFQRLRQAGLPRTVLPETEVDHARDHPPPDTPAAVRGRHIRESAGREQVRVNWEAVVIGHGPKARTIHLDAEASDESDRPPHPRSR